MLFGSIVSFENAALNGRIVADKAFLNALLTENPFSDYHLFFPSEQDIHAFKTQILDHPAISYLLLDHLPDYLGAHDYQVFHNFSPFIAKDLYLRKHFARHPFPITGFTHTLASQPMMSNFVFSLLNDPAPFDGIICSCDSARQVMTQLFAHIAETYGPALNFPIQFQGKYAVIPIGSADFTPNTSHDTARSRLRKELQISDSDCLFLTMGRFSPSSKIDLFPLLQMIRQLNAPDIQFVFAGSGDPDTAYVQDLKTLIDQYQIANQVHLVLNLTNSEKEHYYKAADVYFGLADNFQETFGISNVEAMKFGLPILALDWNGFRDTVQNGKNGFLIPTFLMEQGPTFSKTAPVLGEKFAFLFSQQTFFDAPACQRAIIKLAQTPDLRLEMGRHSRKLYESHYQWPGIIQRYVQFWQTLKEQARCTPYQPRFTMPYLDFPTVFRHYPTRFLASENVHLAATELGKRVLNGTEIIEYFSELAPYLSLNAIIKTLAYFETSKPLAPFNQLAPRLLNGLSNDQLQFLTGWLIKQQLLGFKHD